jgi:hypothetical protein
MKKNVLAMESQYQLLYSGMYQLNVLGLKMFRLGEPEYNRPILIPAYVGLFNRAKYSPRDSRPHSILSFYCEI